MITFYIFSVVGTDCAALYSAGVNVSGIYTLQPDLRNGSDQFEAYCDMENDGGGWTVIQVLSHPSVLNP